MKTIGLDDELEFDTPQWLCVDVANGYMECFIEFLQKVRRMYPTLTIIAGNIKMQEGKILGDPDGTPLKFS